MGAVQAEGRRKLKKRKPRTPSWLRWLISRSSFVALIGTTAVITLLATMVVAIISNQQAEIRRLKDSPEAHFKPDDGFDSEGPAFFCYRDEDSGIRNNKLQCLDYRKMIEQIERRKAAQDGKQDL